jgi:hypothetical protein
MGTGYPYPKATRNCQVNDGETVLIRSQQPDGQDSPKLKPALVPLQLILRRSSKDSRCSFDNIGLIDLMFKPGPLHRQRLDMECLSERSYQRIVKKETLINGEGN